MVIHEKDSGQVILKASEKPRPVPFTECTCSVNNMSEHVLNAYSTVGTMKRAFLF